MRSKGYRKCHTCEASVPPHKHYCRPCSDRRREEREAKYRKAKQERIPRAQPMPPYDFQEPDNGTNSTTTSTDRSSE